MNSSENTGTARRVLLTCASGMLGGAVAQLLRDKGHHVRTFQRGASASATDEVRGSLTDQQAVAAAVESMDAVIHLAAKVSFTGAWEDFVATNITGTSNLLEASKDAGVKDF